MQYKKKKKIWNNIISILLIVLTTILFISCDLLFEKSEKVSPHSSEFIVSFNSNEGTAVVSQTVKKGKTATKPVDPIKEEYIFDNWYSDKDFKTKYNFDTPVTKNITLYAKWIPILLNGAFTVDDYHNKVQFTKGNLYWDGDSFEIEENQFAYPTTWDESHVSHFYYSKEAEVAYAEAFGSYTNILFTNSTETTPNPDFTVSGVRGKYRSLSWAEWYFLLYTRTASIVNETSNARFAKAKINTDTKTVNGLLLFPDIFEWTETMGNPPAYVNEADKDWAKISSYTLEQLEEMEKYGCVFIPAAGHRYGSLLYDTDCGHIWTASKLSNSYCAYIMDFSSGNICVTPVQCSYGQSMRLVSDKPKIMEK